MNQRTAEAMAEKVKGEVGKRGKVCIDQMPAHGFNWPSYWMVLATVDNHLHLGFAEPHQWSNLKAQYAL